MVYFAADVHLGAGSPDRVRAVERRFVAWLDRAGADAGTIVLAGDIFDFRFEYRRVVPKGFVRTLGKLAELSDRGVRILYFTGNHDMWLTDYLVRECGVELRFAPEVMTLGGQRVYVAHGDNLPCEKRPATRLLNTVFRWRWLRRAFSWGVHPDLAMRFGLWWSASTRRRHAAEGPPRAAFTEPLIAFAREYAARHRVDHFVFGHMHYPRDYREEGLHTLHLGCWEEHPSYGLLDDAGNLTLKYFDR